LDTTLSSEVTCDLEGDHDPALRLEAFVFVHEFVEIDGKVVSFCKAASVDATQDPSAHDRQHRVALLFLAEFSQADEEEDSEMVRSLLDLKESRETLEDLDLERFVFFVSFVRSVEHGQTTAVTESHRVFPSRPNRAGV
jgi:hypothetical protein